MDEKTRLTVHERGGVTNDDLPSTPWDIEFADQIKLGVSQQLAHDVVALSWLYNGDPKPLSAWMLDTNYQPGPEVRKLLALMLLGKDYIDGPLLTLAKKLPHSFSVTNARNARDMEKSVRDQLLAREVHQLIERHGFKYDQAVARVKEFSADLGVSLGEKTIRNAYDSRHGKRKRD